jgi:DNA-binding CsgD family transcriptional regulator
MMSAHDRSRAVERMASLAACAESLVPFWRSATQVLRGAIDYYWTPCWYTVDPASLLITSHYNEDMAAFPREWLEHEYFADDVNTIAAVARSPGGISTLQEATSGHPANSPRWRQNMEMGGDQELILALRTSDSETWGALGLYRAPGSPLFDDAEKRFLLALAPHLAAGARRALLQAGVRESTQPGTPGLLLLDAGLGLVSASGAGRAWLEALGGGIGEALPRAIAAVAGRALEGEASSARVRAKDGSWLTLHAEPLLGEAEARVSVIIEPAGAAALFPLLASSFGLTPREREVTLLVLRGGHSTADIADELSISAHTVQQHLKSVFDKTGVRSRRDLAGMVFFAHFEPRLRDNERRAAEGRDLLGGPHSPAAG